jgi:hypothetical protein
MYVYTYVCLYTYVCIQACKCACRKCVCIRIYTPTFVLINMYAYNTHQQVRTHTCTHNSEEREGGKKRARKEEERVRGRETDIEERQRHTSE